MVLISPVPDRFGGVAHGQVREHDHDVAGDAFWTARTSWNPWASGTRPV